MLDFSAARAVETEESIRRSRESVKTNVLKNRGRGKRDWSKSQIPNLKSENCDAGQTIELRRLNPCVNGRRDSSVDPLKRSGNGNLVFIVFEALHTFGGTAGTEPAIHKWVEVAIHDGLDVAGLNARAEILDHAVGLEDVAANLVTPGDVALLAVKPFHLRFLLVDALGINL